jgi:hypothetical protein
MVNIPHCDTINYQLSTLNYILPFQGDLVGDNFDPTRWVGLAYVVLSGRRKNKNSTDIL